MDNTLKGRIKSILAENKISVNNLSSLIEIGQRTLNNQINGKVEPSIHTLTALSDYFGVSIDWMVYGTGEKYKKREYSPDQPLSSRTDDQNTSYKKKQEIHIALETKPLLPYTIKPGSISKILENDRLTQRYELLPIVPFFPKYDFTIQIKGESMEPEYRTGDEIACLQIKENQFIQWGRVHLLDTPQGILLKRIYDDGDNILCKSEYSEKYPDFRISKSDIHSLYLVVGLLRM